MVLIDPLKSHKYPWQRMSVAVKSLSLRKLLFVSIFLVVLVALLPSRSMNCKDAAMKCAKEIEQNLETRPSCIAERTCSSSHTFVRTVDPFVGGVVALSNATFESFVNPRRRVLVLFHTSSDNVAAFPGIRKLFRQKRKKLMKYLDSEDVYPMHLATVDCSREVALCQLWARSFPLGRVKLFHSGVGPIHTEDCWYDEGSGACRDSSGNFMFKEDKMENILDQVFFDIEGAYRFTGGGAQSHELGLINNDVSHQSVFPIFIQFRRDTVPILRASPTKKWERFAKKAAQLNLHPFSFEIAHTSCDRWHRERIKQYRESFRDPVYCSDEPLKDYCFPTNYSSYCPNSGAATYWWVPGKLDAERQMEMYTGGLHPKDLLAFAISKLRDRQHRDIVHKHAIRVKRMVDWLGRNPTMDDTFGEWLSGEVSFTSVTADIWDDFIDRADKALIFFTKKKSLDFFKEKLSFHRVYLDQNLTAKRANMVCEDSSAFCSLPQFNISVSFEKSRLVASLFKRGMRVCPDLAENVTAASLNDWLESNKASLDF